MPKRNLAPSYSQLSEQLNEALAWFESEDLDIDQAPVRYQEVQKIIAQMEKHLKEAKNKITIAG